MVYINGLPFHHFPLRCYDCPFFANGGIINKGICILFDKQKNKYDSPPKRCQQLFDKAETFPEGTKLVIVIK